MFGTDIFYPYQINLFSLDQSQVISWIDSVPKHQTVILFTIEYVPEETIIGLYNRLLGARDQRSIIWVLNESIGYSDAMDRVLGENLVRLDFDLMMYHMHMDVSKICTTNQEWNPSTKRFLFLTGKPDRANRLGLLYQFHQQSLLSKCDWSLHIESEATARKCRALLSSLSDPDYESFVSTHLRNPDSIRCTISDSNTNPGMHYSGYPFDCDLYKNTSFRVIAETQMFGAPITSEKTWITIANLHPFIMAGYQHNLAQLKHKGFKTFDQYLPVPDYDDIADESERFSAVVENTRYWLDHIDQHQDDIQQDLLYNRDLMRHYINQAVETAKQLYDRINYREIPWTRLLPWFSIEQTSWMLFYYRIRDQSWPECYSSQNFDQLPQHIQQECIEQFGYRKENF